MGSVEKRDQLKHEISHRVGILEGWDQLGSLGGWDHLGSVKGMRSVGISVSMGSLEGT